MKEQNKKNNALAKDISPATTKANKNKEGIFLWISEKLRSDIPSLE